MKLTFALFCLVLAGIGPGFCLAGEPALPCLGDSLRALISGQDIGKEIDGAQYNRLWSWLRQPSTGGHQIIEMLSHDPKIKDLFAQSAGVNEGYTVEQHTLRVYEVLRDQSPHFPMDSLKTPGNIDIPNLLKFSVALHDIGKPLAVKAGNKATQHIYTVPVMTEMMEKLGFNQSEIDIAKAIVDNDVLGELLKGRIGLEQAHRELNELAGRTTLTPKDYFKLQSLFYTIDAASYPYLRQRVFVEKDGALVPSDPRYEALQRMFESP